LDRTLRPESLPVRVASSRRTAQRGDPFVEHAVAGRLCTTVERPTISGRSWRYTAWALDRRDRASRHRSVTSPPTEPP